MRESSGRYLIDILIVAYLYRMFMYSERSFYRISISQNNTLCKPIRRYYTRFNTHTHTHASPCMFRVRTHARTHSRQLRSRVQKTMKTYARTRSRLMRAVAFAGRRSLHFAMMRTASSPSGANTHAVTAAHPRCVRAQQTALIPHIPPSDPTNPQPPPPPH